MDVNSISGESKSFGSVPPVAPAMVRQDKQKMPVMPVASSADTESGKALSQQEGKPSREQTIQYVREIQARFDKMGTNLQFSIDNSSEDVVVKITAKDSGELIRQFPSEAILQLRNQLNDLVGTLFEGMA